VRPLAPQEKEQANTQGSLVVEEVSGPAQAAEVEPGDIILGINGKRVHSVKELQDAPNPRQERGAADPARGRPDLRTVAPAVTTCKRATIPRPSSAPRRSIGTSGAPSRCVEDATRPKYYCLSMLPYPSGRLHMGHVRNYTIGDVLARYLRMHGYNVLAAHGLDAFGLPAENAAISNGVPPARWTRENIAHMRAQLKSLGFAIDWRRELASCDPDYYRWNQWLFPAHARAGHRLPQDRGRELGSGRSDRARQRAGDRRPRWRTGAPVEKREIPMYYLAITRYAQELLEALDTLSEWPERVRVMQANWIGRSEGCDIAFPYAADTVRAAGSDGALKVFTTRADYTLRRDLHGESAAEHPVALAAARTTRAGRVHRRSAAAAA